MSKSYELTTLQDVWDKVPSDRIMDCLEELGKLLQATKATAELFGEAHGFKLTFPLVWNDDGKRTLQTNFVSGDEKLMSLKISHKQTPKSPA